MRHEHLGMKIFKVRVWVHLFVPLLPIADTIRMMGKNGPLSEEQGKDVWSRDLVGCETRERGAKKKAGSYLHEDRRKIQGKSHLPGRKPLRDFLKVCKYLRW